jgi:hypothetical protein
LAGRIGFKEQPGQGASLLDGDAVERTPVVRPLFDGMSMLRLPSDHFQDIASDSWNIANREFFCTSFSPTPELSSGSDAFPPLF